MEIILLAILTAMFLGLVALNKQIAFMGLIGGVALIILGLATASSGVQMQVGLNQTMVGSTDVIVFTYANINTVYPGADTLANIILPIILGAGGLLAFIYAATSSKW
jgi:hypothetical protein